MPSLYPRLCRGVVPTALIMRLDFDVLALRPLDISKNKKISARTHHRKYVVLVSVSTRTYISEYTHLISALSDLNP